MHQYLLETIVCPLCRRSLQLVSFENGETDLGHILIDKEGTEIFAGLLKCSCGEEYPIVEGVPRFLDAGINHFPAFIERHQKELKCVCFDQGISRKPVVNDSSEDYENIRSSFSQEWELFDYDHDKTWGWTLEDRKKVFLGDMNLEPKDLAGRRLLDAGCGNGTLTAALSEFGLEVVGMDLNDGLGLAYRNRTKYSIKAKETVQYVQANLVKPPLKEESFDLVYSSGVIHHTPSSKAAFDSLVRLTKRGGRLYIWVYGKRALPVRMFFSFGRHLKHWLSFKSLLHVCELMAPFYKVATITLNGLRIAPFRSRTMREITLDLFDAFAPRYNHWHTEVQVRSWFEEQGFQNINTSGRQKHGFGVYGDRC